jgi:ADP-ribose pyrophosphatase YjhB (NUDIX family)
MIMLRNVSAILNFSLLAEDGEIGRCKDFLFDDEKWTIRYMVADTRKWLPGRKVLISPISLGAVDWSTRLFQVELTRRQVGDSPMLEEDAPVSRQYEIIYGNYFGTPSYWGGANIWGSHPNPSLLRGEHDKLATDFEGPEDNHLRSVKEVTGYHIQATDDEIGHVEDLVVDDEVWALRYVVVDTRNWLPGRKVLVSPQWATAVDWAEEKLFVDLTTDTIKNSPEYEPLAPISRDYERALHDYYGQSFYWK